jgi:hypothetical protein
MKNQNCKSCGIRNDIHEMIHGKSIINDTCIPCRRQVLEAGIARNQKRSAENPARGETVVFARNLSQTGGEWSPEIAEAMRMA